VPEPFKKALSYLGQPVPVNDDLPITTAGRRALGRPAAETLRHAWKNRIGTSVFDEFSRVDVIKGQIDRKRLTSVVGRRQAIADALAECCVGAWVAIGEPHQHSSESRYRC
jgi:hypothetical protein